MKLIEKSFEVSAAGREEVLRRVCSEFGYCSLGDAYDRLLENPPETIVEFVDAIIAGEGLNPETVTNGLKRRIRDLVIDAVDRHGGRIW